VGRENGGGCLESKARASVDLERPNTMNAPIHVIHQAKDTDHIKERHRAHTTMYNEKDKIRPMLRHVLRSKRRLDMRWVVGTLGLVLCAVPMIVRALGAHLRKGGGPAFPNRLLVALIGFRRSLKRRRKQLSKRLKDCRGFYILEATFYFFAILILVLAIADFFIVTGYNSLANRALYLAGQEAAVRGAVDPVVNNVFEANMPTARNASPSVLVGSIRCNGAVQPGNEPTETGTPIRLEARYEVPSFLVGFLTGLATGHGNSYIRAKRSTVVMAHTSFVGDVPTGNRSC